MMSTPIATMIREMAAAGCSVEIIAKTVELAETHAQGVTQASPGALRTRRWRERKASQVTSPVTSLGGTIGGEAISLEDKKESKRRRIAMSDDWRPSDKAWNSLLSKGFDNPKIEQEVDRMRNWAIANGKTSTNWDLNLYNWMADKQGYNGHSKPNLQLTDQERYERAREAFRTGRSA